MELKTITKTPDIDKYLALCDEIEYAYVAAYLKRPIKVQAYKSTGLTSIAANVAAISMHNRPHVKGLIEAIMEAELMGGIELLRDTHANATANLATCMASHKVEFTPRIKKPLAKIIEALEAEVEFEMLVNANSPPKTKKEQKAFERWRIAQNKTILRYELELRLNPKATRIVSGETVLRDELYLDMKQVVEKGYQIEKVEHDKNGRLKVALVSPTAAKERLFKVAGLYEKDNAQKAPVMNIIIQSGDDEIGTLNIDQHQNEDY